MGRRYHSLSYSLLTSRALLCAPEQLPVKRATLDDPAVSVMADFRRIPPITIARGASLSAAYMRMLACGVRVLFVVDKQGGALGIVSENELLHAANAPSSGQRLRTRVDEAMIPLGKIDAISYVEALRASVGNITETFRVYGNTHLLVVESVGTTSELSVRGMFSAAQIAPLLSGEESGQGAGGLADAEEELVGELL